MKHRIIIFSILLSMVLSGTYAEGLSKTVNTIDWKSYKKVKPSPEFLMSSKLVANGSRYSYTWANEYYKTSASGDYFIIDNVNKEQPIRTPSSAAIGIAMTLKTGVNEDLIGVSHKELTKCAVKLIKGVVKNHRVNGGKWGKHWQSTLWAAQVGRAGWMLWDDLDHQTREWLCKAVVFEADRHIKPSYKIKHWNGIGGDSKAEEISWDVMPIQLAVAMFPNHPHSQQWKEICSKMMMNAYSLEADMQKTKPHFDGKPPSEWLEGYNMREDTIIINHSLLHNDYMVSIAHLQMSGFLVFSMARQPVPQSLDFNFRNVYKTLTCKQFSAPPFESPGGTMYIPGSPNQYYPGGTDWSRYRYACYYGMDALADILGYDKKLPKAADWRKLRGERILEMQSRHENGRMYANGEYTNYWGAEQMVFWMFADAHFLQWLDDHKAISKKKNWLKD